MTNYPYPTLPFIDLGLSALLLGIQSRLGNRLTYSCHNSVSAFRFHIAVCKVRSANLQQTGICKDT